MAYDEHLAEALRALFAGRPDITERRMFGGFIWVAEGAAKGGALGKRVALAEAFVGTLDAK